MSGKWPKYPYAHYSVDYKVHSCLIIIIQCCFCCSCFSCTLVIQVCLTLYITVFFFHISIWEIFAFYNSKHSLCVDVLLVMQSIVCKFNVIISSFTFQYWNTYNRLQNQLDWTEIKWSKYWRSRRWSLFVTVREIVDTVSWAICVLFLTHVQRRLKCTCTSKCIFMQY